MGLKSQNLFHNRLTLRNEQIGYILVFGKKIKNEANFVKYGHTLWPHFLWNGNSNYTNCLLSLSGISKISKLFHPEIRIFQK